MSIIPSVLTELEQERIRITYQLSAVSSALSLLNSSPSKTTGRRHLSAQARAKIAAAQRARWAKAKGKKVVAISSPKRARMSAQAIAKIRAAQKARWAKWRKQQKAA